MESVSCGVVSIMKDVKSDVKGRHIIIVEDLVDTGRTLNLLITRFRELGAASVACAVLLDKAVEGRAGLDSLKYVGFKVPDRFIVGYGASARVCVCVCVCVPLR